MSSPQHNIDQKKNEILILFWDKGSLFLLGINFRIDVSAL